MTIKVYTDIQEMTGIGEEWLVKNIHTEDYFVIAKFFEGRLEGHEDTAVSVNGKEITKGSDV